MKNDEILKMIDCLRLQEETKSPAGRVCLERVYKYITYQAPLESKRNDLVDAFLGSTVLLEGKASCR
jgi:hypothetical protein